MTTCDEFRLNLSATQARRDRTAEEVRQAQADVKELESEASHVNPAITKAAQAALGETDQRLDQLDAALAALWATRQSGSGVAMQAP